VERVAAGIQVCWKGKRAGRGRELEGLLGSSLEGRFREQLPVYKE